MPHETGALPVAQGDGAVVKHLGVWGVFLVFWYQGAIFFKGEKGFVFVFLLVVDLSLKY